MSKVVRGDFLGGDGLAEAGGEGCGQGLPAVILPGPGRGVRRFAEDLLPIVRENGLYRRDTVPVVVNGDEGRLDEIGASGFVGWAEGRAMIGNLKQPKPRKVGEGELVWPDPIFQEQSMKRETAATLLGMPEFVSGLKAVERIYPVPLPRWGEDDEGHKTVELMEPGYDVPSRALVLDPGFRIPAGTGDAKEDAAEAMDWFEGLYGQFPFEGEDRRSFSVQIAAMLGVFVAGLLPVGALRPAFVYTANSQRSGKTLLAKCAVAPVFGIPDTKSIGKGEELQKALDSIALEGRGYVIFDNIKVYQGSEGLEQFLTSPMLSGRVLGGNKMFRVPNVCQVILTGNDLSMSSDLSNRSLICSLFMREADPQKRPALKNPLTDVTLGDYAWRAKALGALWALVRYWVSKGMPPGRERLAGFEEWASLVGGICEAVSLPNPLTRPQLESGGDEDYQEMSELMRLLHAEMVEYGVGSLEKTPVEMRELCLEHNVFRHVFGAAEKEEDIPHGKKSVVGKMWSEKYHGRVFEVEPRPGADAVRLEFGQRGDRRSKKWTIKLL